MNYLCYFTPTQSWITMKIKQCNQLLFLFTWLLLPRYLSCAADGTTISSHNNSLMCIEHERDALLRFKQGIRLDRCGLLSSWGDHEDNKNCCQWHGVRCSHNTGHVIMLDLHGVATDEVSELCLQGNVGSSLVDLKHLRYLDLSFNYFEGQLIPSFIGSLVNLKHLNLSNIGFKGEIPQRFGNLSNLTSLDLSCNSYGLFQEIYVKNLLWLSRLTLLRRVSLSGVDLSKATNWLQIVNNLPYLRVLRLAECKLPPSIPKPLSYKNSSTTLSVLSLAQNDLDDSTIFEWLFNLSGIDTHLAHLDLSYNQLKGPLPSSFADMQSLSFLSLSSNQLEGPIPDSISKIKPLTYLDLSVNSFHSLPKSLGNLCSLQELVLESNNLNNDLPNIIQTLTRCASTSLLYLDLSENQIWGSVPNLISAFSSLEYLSLSDNRLNGTIAQSIGKLSNLNILDLSSNYLKDTISSIHFSNLFRLTTLDLGNNSRLVLNISDDWVPPFQLGSINLRSCRIGPLFPKWLLSQITNCFNLDISNAGIADIIPKSFSLLSPNLVSLNMSHNKIFGTLKELSNLHFRPTDDYVSIEIDISFNNIEGAIPSFQDHVVSLLLNNNRLSNPISLLCPKAEKNLSNLDLSNNLLFGELPDCWMSFPQLSILHLENNNFSGIIPPSIGYLKQLQSLHLRNNTIYGELPTSLENLTSLIILDLGHNLLSGHIPSSIGNSFTSLSILSLRGNNFDGKIPLSLCQMSFLQVLDISSNHITGTLPKCINNFTAMRNGTDFMPQLQYNELDGAYSGIIIDAATIMWKRKEWSFTTFLGLVKAIDISNNKLGGGIPIEIFDLKGLVFLNLSRNNLVGGITPKIGQLTALQALDLSSNQFDGVVPTSLEDLSFLGILDLSSNQLSGEIPNTPGLQRFDAYSYAGNPRLCGLPLPKCPWDQPHDSNPTEQDNVNHHDEKDNDDIFSIGLYVSVVLGFIIGFWGVCGTLVLKRSWRHGFFRSIDNLREKFCVWRRQRSRSA